MPCFCWTQYTAQCAANDTQTCFPRRIHSRCLSLAGIHSSYPHSLFAVCNSHEKVTPLTHHKMIKGLKKRQSNPDFIIVFKIPECFLFQWVCSVYFVINCYRKVILPELSLMDTSAPLQWGSNWRWWLSPWSTACFWYAWWIIK